MTTTNSVYLANGDLLTQSSEKEDFRSLGKSGFVVSKSFKRQDVSGRFSRAVGSKPRRNSRRRPIVTEVNFTCLERFDFENGGDFSYK